MVAHYDLCMSFVFYCVKLCKRSTSFVRLSTQPVCKSCTQSELWNTSCTVLHIHSNLNHFILVLSPGSPAREISASFAPFGYAIDYNSYHSITKS